MTTNDELTRLRTAFAAPPMPAISAKRAPEPEACPPSDRIWLAVRGELPPDELREIVDHIAACPACAEDWRIAMVFEEARPPVPVRYRAWMAVAATILVAVLGYQQIYQHKSPVTPPPYRSGGGQMIESLVPENAAIPRQHFVLSWKRVPGAASYTLTITEAATLTTLHEAKVTTTTYTVPESALASLKSGAKILWAVTPVSRDGGLLQDRTFKAYVIDPPQ
jgi:hypothetical protein